MTTALSTLCLALMGIMATAGSVQANCSKSILPDGSSRFDVRGAEVHDRANRLVWMRCSVGTGTGTECEGDRALISLAEAKAIAMKAGRAWRLPTFEELITLLDQDCGQPAIDTRAFPDVTASGSEGTEEYWTTTPGGINDMMNTVEFSYGYREIRSPGIQRRARLVRSGG